MIRLIVAIDRKQGIAKHGYQPWYIPDDDAYFINQTKTHGGKILVGGITFRNSFRGKPLKDRITYLLTRDKQPIEGVEIVNDLNAWLKAMGGEDIWVVGGANVYDQILSLNLDSELYITNIDADFGCDQFFPDYKSKFHLKSQTEVREQNGFHYTFAIYHN